MNYMHIYFTKILDTMQRTLGSMTIEVIQPVQNIPIVDHAARCTVITYNDLYSNLRDSKFSTDLQLTGKADLILDDSIKDESESITTALESEFKIPIIVELKLGQ